MFPAKPPMSVRCWCNELPILKFLAESTGECRLASGTENSIKSYVSVQVRFRGLGFQGLGFRV